MLPNNNPTRKPICADCGRPMVALCGSEEHLSMIERERKMIAHQNGGIFAPAKKSPVGFGLLLAIGDVCFGCAEKAAFANIEGRYAGNSPLPQYEALVCDAPMNDAPISEMSKGKPKKCGNFLNVRMRVESSEEGESVNSLTPRQRVLLLLWASNHPKRPAFPDSKGE